MKKIFVYILATILLYSTHLFAYDSTMPGAGVQAELDRCNGRNITVGSPGSDEWDFPARAGGWDFDFIIEAVQNVELGSNGTERWYLNGTQLAADTNISNNAPTIGERLTCFSTDTNIYCESDYSDWKQGIFDCSIYDVCQNFEGVVYDNSETWNEDYSYDATVNEDYSITLITGSQSLQIVDGGADGNTFTTFTGHADGTKPSTTDATITTGDAGIYPINTLSLHSSGGGTYIFDRVVVDDSTIGGML